MPTPSHALTRALLTTLAFSACHPVGGPPPPPPPADVSLITVATQTTDEPVNFVGQVAPLRTVQVRAQVSGVITARLFREGAAVHAGDVLYRVDPTNYDADLRGARARLAEAEAKLQNATATAARLRPLVLDHAVAQQDVDNAESELLQAHAGMDDARATLQRSQKASSETIVRAEISGRVGRAQLDVGTRITGPSDVLTTIDVVDPVYVSFRPALEQRFRWSLDPAVRASLAPGGSVRVQAIQPDGTPYPVTGKIGFIDPVVDAATGTQEYRAEFVSRDQMLVPGQFVRVQLLGVRRGNVILIPQRAVVQQLGRQSVYVVDASGRVEVRAVKASAWSGADWLIESGLAAGDRVVVDGLQKIGPGAIVHATAMPAGDSARATTTLVGSAP